MDILRQKISIVVCFYFNEENIPYTIPRLKNLSTLLPEYEFEYIFVDDGSKDNTLSLLLQEKEKDERIKVLKLSKNFGSVAATQAGLKYATGDAVGIISSDLQDPPELFVEMQEKWKKGKKIVMATRSDRDESFLQKMFSNSYYSLMRKYAIKDYPSGGFDFVFMDKQIVTEINHIKEKNTNLMSLIFWLGHDQDRIAYVRQKREIGKSRWTLSKKIKLFVDSFVSFSYSPIRFMSILGFVVAFISFIYGIYVISSALTGNISTPGWSSIIAIVTFLLGMIMIMLGIIGEYLWRILDESRNRPIYIVDEYYD